MVVICDSEDENLAALTKSPVLCRIAEQLAIPLLANVVLQTDTNTFFGIKGLILTERSSEL